MIYKNGNNKRLLESISKIKKAWTHDSVQTDLDVKRKRKRSRSRSKHQIFGERKSPARNLRVETLDWSRWEDLNLRPPRPERGALPNWATPRKNTPEYRGIISFGCGTRIRTQTNRVRVCCATFTQYHSIYCCSKRFFRSNSNYYSRKNRFVKGLFANFFKFFLFVLF